jgi:hypothetical protein
MSRFMTQPWESIRQFYLDRQTEGLPSVGPMVELVTKIVNSPYASGLHAWTSMFDLCIVQVPVSYPYEGPYLKVVSADGGKLDFRYIDIRDQSKQWHRLVDGADAFHRLESFIDQLHWFSRVP